MSCHTNICKARCCYNVPLDAQEHLAFADKIVNPIVSVLKLDGRAVVPMTDPYPSKNKCPFLTADYKCNIYEHRPAVCRKFGEIPQLKCKYLKQKNKQK
jgi:Fe-S-cluster containining protein